MSNTISNVSQVSSRLFATLDTRKQGYLEKSDLASAFSQIASKNGDSTSVDDVFSALDNDQDGKVTESEFSGTLAKLQEALDGQFNQTRMRRGGSDGGPQGTGGMPPPPPPQGRDPGFTKDELSGQLEQIGSSDSQRAGLISSIVNNFEAADTNGDGKVSFEEAIAYDQSQSTGSDSTTGSRSGTAASDAQVMMKIMQLAHAYGVGADSQPNDTSSSLLSVTA
jgi:Ca2+-binding EF-hand superfamily protein